MTVSGNDFLCNDIPGDITDSSQNWETEIESSDEGLEESQSAAEKVIEKVVEKETNYVLPDLTTFLSRVEDIVSENRQMTTEFIDDYFSVVEEEEIAVYAEGVTDGISINSGALSYFSGVLGNRLIPVDYVCYVGRPYWMDNRQRYEYCLAYGKLDLSGTKFTGQGDIIRYRADNPISVVVDKNVSIDVTASLAYGRSNLGDYSGIVDSVGTLDFLIFLGLCFGGVLWFIKSISALFWR